jgi:hypothetical protein
MLMVSSLVLQSSPLQKICELYDLNDDICGRLFSRNSLTHIFSSQLGVAGVHFIQRLQEIQTHLKHRECLKLSILSTRDLIILETACKEELTHLDFSVQKRAK